MHLTLEVMANANLDISIFDVTVSSAGTTQDGYQAVTRLQTNTIETKS